ncbi:MAG: pyridoxamine 5'-phosphate oxidase [Pseudomonadota bacterium]
MDLGGVRREYESQRVDKSDLDANPIEQFRQWLQTARDLNLLDSTAMTLATAGRDGQPSCRVVLLKHVDELGFCWYTDSRSQKGQQLAENPKAALLFHWRDLSRQIRIQGEVEKLPSESAETYFNSRPEGSRFSAAASHQTSVVESRAYLESEVLRLREKYPGGNVPRPEAWIGYRLVPDYFEFWQGQDSRLHDRICYLPIADGWQMQRLSP